MYKLSLIICLFLMVLAYQNRKADTFEKPVTLGAYYFNGWKPDSRHVTDFLIDSFPEREPIWGWVTNTQEVMDAQINGAADAGLSFFSFCWYYNKRKPLEGSNTIINTYLNSPNRERLKYCLLVANHPNNEIGPNDWRKVTAEWVRQFKSSSYLTVDGKPLLIIFDVNSLIEQFDGPENVKEAFGILRKEAQKEGLKGVTIAACASPSKNGIRKAEACGYDILTAYNYPSAGFNTEESRQTPIDSLINAERRIWNRIIKASTLPYLPASTLNWDARPWADSTEYHTKRYYVGYSSGSVYRSTRSLIEWIKEHKQHTTKDQIGMLYAWNEYGEGAWLTPSINSKERLLDGVKRAMKE